MRRLSILACALGFALSACGGDDGDKPADAGVPDAGPPLFEEKPECNPATAITPFQGAHPMVISFLEIGKQEDGFDLDGDGDPDNKLHAVGTLARGAIEDAFANFTIVIPMEFYDFAERAVDDCVKFAIYLGIYSMDVDLDDDETAKDDGDCNDHDGAINKDAAEVPDNLKDDDCDGLADEVDTTDESGAVTTTPSTNTDDTDQDLVTIADGDCDDTDPTVLGTTADEVCGDGLDNDCDGNADWGKNEAGDADCSPYDSSPDLLALDPLSFNQDGSPVISFTSGETTEVVDEGETVLRLHAGPSLFSVGIPVTDELNLDLRITGATIEANVIESGADLAFDKGRLGGVIDSHTADTIRGLDVPDIGLRPEDSLLDATFANLLGTLIGLPKLPIGHPWEGCMTPDIDVDRDGLEAFCDSDPLDEVKVVDVCIDGNGDEIRDTDNGDGTVTQCTEAKGPDGKYRFVDGISVEINFKTVPTILPSQVN